MKRFIIVVVLFVVLSVNGHAQRGCVYDETPVLCSYCKSLQYLPRQYPIRMKPPLFGNVSNEAVLEFCSFMSNYTATKQQKEEAMVNWAENQTNITQERVKNYTQNLAALRNETVNVLKSAASELSQRAQAVIETVTDTIANMDISYQDEREQLIAAQQNLPLSVRAEIWAVMRQLQTNYMQQGKAFPYPFLVTSYGCL